MTKKWIKVKYLLSNQYSSSKNIRCVPIKLVYRTDSGNAATNLSLRQKENMPVDSKTLDRKVAVTFKIVFN